MSDVSAVTNLIPTVNEGFVTTVGGSGVTSGGATVPLTSMSGLTNGTIFVGIVEPGLTNQQVFTGTVDTGGSQLTGVKWTRGANVAHSAGKTVVDYVTGTTINMLAKAMAVHADQDGTLKAGAVDNAAALASNVVTTAKILDANVTYAKLLTTIFSGQVTTYTNPGTAGGTNSFFYINLGGIKLFWGKTASIAISGTGFQSTAKVITFPVGFFSTIQTCLPGVDQPSNSQFLGAVNSLTPTTTSVEVTLTQSSGSNGSAAVNLFVVGT